jgi:hypothetical protein
MQTVGFLYLMPCQRNDKDLIKIGITSGNTEAEMYNKCERRRKDWEKTAEGVIVKQERYGNACFEGGPDDALYHERELHKLVADYNVPIFNTNTGGYHTEFFLWNDTVIDCVNEYLHCNDITLHKRRPRKQRKYNSTTNVGRKRLPTFREANPWLFK